MSLFLLCANKACPYAHKAHTYGCLNRSYPSPLPVIVLLSQTSNYLVINSLFLCCHSSRMARLQFCLGLGVTAMMNRAHKKQKPSIIYYHSTYANMYKRSGGDLGSTCDTLEARNTLTMGCFSRKERVCDCHAALQSYLFLFHLCSRMFISHLAELEKKLSDFLFLLRLPGDCQIKGLRHIFLKIQPISSGFAHSYQ